MRLLKTKTLKKNETNKFFWGDGLARTRSGNDVKLIVSQVKIQIVQDSLLIASPFSVKFQKVFLTRCVFVLHKTKTKY